MPFTGSLWHKGGFLHGTERIYGREPSLDISLYQVENSFTVLLEDISRLRSDPDTVDFVLRTSKGSRVFPVHKAILASRSNVFRTMFVSNMVEASAGEAVIEDLDEETLEEMIHFLYTGGLSGSRYDVISLCYAAR